jgi:SMC interacting uncharacterized protein involved in chromosome segregation
VKGELAGKVRECEKLGSTTRTSDDSVRDLKEKLDQEIREANGLYEKMIKYRKKIKTLKLQVNSK